MAGSSDDARTDWTDFFDAAAEVDRLRAELDRHRVAGDELAAALHDVTTWNIDHHFGLAGNRADAARDRWRSVRGDAPRAGAGPYDALRAEISAGAADHDRRAGRAAAPTDGQAPADELRGTDGPTFDDLLGVVRGSMPHGVDPDGGIARNIATGLDLHLSVDRDEHRNAERWYCPTCRAWPDDPMFDLSTARWQCQVCATPVVSRASAASAPGQDGGA